MAIKDLTLNIGGNTADLERSLKTAQGKIKLFAAGVAALGAAAVVGFNDFSKFQSGLSDVVTLLDDASFKTKTFEQGVKSLKDGVLDVGAKTGESFDTLNKSLFDLVSAGVDAEKSIDALRVSTNLAIAGATDTSTAVDGITSALNAYSLEADQAQAVAEKFFTAQKGGKTTIQELSDGFGLAGASANAFGVSLDELLSAVAAVTTGGIKTNSAYTGLNAVLSNIAKPTKDAADEAARLGVEFNSTALRTKGLKGFLDEVTQSAHFNDTSLEKLFGSVEALKVAQALTGAQSIKFSEILGQLGDKSLLASNYQAALAEKMSNAERQTQIMQRSIETASIALGQLVAPAVTAFMQEVAETAIEASVGLGAMGDLFKNLGILGGEAINSLMAKFDEFNASFAATMASNLEWINRFVGGIPLIGNAVQNQIDLLNAESAEYALAAQERAERSAAFWGTAEQQKTEALQQGIEERNSAQFENDALMDEYDQERRDADLEKDLERREEDLALEDERSAEDLERLRSKILSEHNVQDNLVKDQKKNKQKAERDMLKIKADRVTSEKQLDQQIADSSIGALSTIVGGNKAAQAAIFVIQKGMAIARTLAETQEAGMLAYASQLIPGDPSSIARAEIARQTALASGQVHAAAIAATALPQLASSFIGAQKGGRVAGTGSGDKYPYMLEANEIIVPQRHAETFDKLFGNFPSGEQSQVSAQQNVSLEISMTEEASQLFTLQQREDRYLGISS